MRAVRRVLVALTALLTVAPPVGHAASSIVLPKAGQIGFGIGGGYGTLLDSGNVGSVFGSGPTLSVCLRYRMRYERALGLSFQAQAPDARVPAGPFDEGVPSSIAPTELKLIVSGVEFYQMFDTRSRAIKMLMVGAGLAQMRAKLNSDEWELTGDNSGDGLYVSGGAGLERFFYRSWAWDLSARYFAIFRDGEANHDLQATLGVIFYAGY